MSSSTVGVGVDDLVTGEAVALELPAAGIAMHALSGILDVSVAVLALVIGLIVVPIVTQGADAAIANVAVTVLLIMVFVVLPTAMETLTRGRSVGKFATGLRTSATMPGRSGSARH
jgi:uncharacterized RDD family membrane protein YckC